MPTLPPPNVSLWLNDAQGTFISAPDYRSDRLGPEYYANRPVRIGPNDTFAQDEVILRFRPDVPIDQQNALMAANAMRMGRPIYKERAFVAKVASGRALAVANALRGNPLLEVASVNTIVSGFHDDANDPLIGQQEPLLTCNARTIPGHNGGWQFAVGQHQVSLVAILDDGVDGGNGSNGGGTDHISHPDFSHKYKVDNWHSVVSDDPSDPSVDTTSHGTRVAGLATADTNNGQYIAGSGYTAWPLVVKVLTDNGGCAPSGFLADAITGVNWAKDHGATVINMSWGCSRGVPGCDPSQPNDAIQALRGAILNAYDRGITLVAAAGNLPIGGNTARYPCSFGQLQDDVQYGWPINNNLVLCIGGSRLGTRYVDSVYGEQLDFMAPYRQEDGQDILSTTPTESSACNTNTYTDRARGTSFSAPMVSGMAGIITSMGYSNNDVWQFMKSYSKDLPCYNGAPCPGFDNDTGWGLMDMYKTMAAAQRPTGTVDLSIVPNADTVGVQRFSLQASRFSADPGTTVNICYAAPGQAYVCTPQPVIDHGLAGMTLQPGASSPIGVWSVYMCQNPSGPCTPRRTFTVLPPPQ